MADPAPAFPDLPMHALSPANAIHLQAAQEFLKKSQPAEAGQVFENISSEERHHPEVLETRWEILAQAAQWETALEVAESLCQVTPDNHLVWLYRACSLDELGRRQEAYNTLAKEAAKFPEVPTIPYNLACCACKLGRMKDASGWLAKAIEVGGRAEIKLMALDDPDLAPLLDEICAL